MKKIISLKLCPRNLFGIYGTITEKCHNGSYLENSLAYTCACDNDDDISTVLSTA